MIDPAWQHIRDLIVQGKDILINGKLLKYYCNLTLNVSVSTPQSREGLDSYQRLVSSQICQRLGLEEIGLEPIDPCILIIQQFTSPFINSGYITVHAFPETTSLNNH